MGQRQGIENTEAKLTEQQVREIKKLLVMEKRPALRRIAERYNVSYVTISKIKHGQIWKHINVSNDLS
jgi:hypothetical protein